MASFILAVDDTPVNLEFISYLLTSRGYLVKTATSVMDGLELIDKSRPCLIISDLNLPHRSGFDFLKKVKEQPELKDIPFVMMSCTSQSQADAERARRMGAAKFIFRPMEAQTLLDEIEPYLEKCN